MKLMVLDGNSILNRSYYGIRPLTTKDGFYTQAIYGFLVTMARLEDEERPDAVCVTFDRREPTFRHLEYEGYKAQRKGMPEELAMQLPVMKEVLDAMNIPRYELAGYEADDLIGTISRKCEAAGWDCVAATGDKDSLQLITEHTTVKLISTRMGQTTTKRMTPESFAEEYGFEPIHIIDLKALMGDASDNIPGVPGIGEKTAMALVQKYRSIDEIYRLLPELDAKPGVIKKLTEGEESARQSYHLATILTDAPLEFTPQDNLRKAPSDALYPLLMRLEFHKLIEKMGLKPAAEPLSAAETVECTVTVETVTSAERAEECLARLRASPTTSTPRASCTRKSCSRWTPCPPNSCRWCRSWAAASRKWAPPSATSWNSAPCWPPRPAAWTPLRSSPPCAARARPSPSSASAARPRRTRPTICSP